MLWFLLILVAIISSASPFQFPVHSLREKSVLTRSELGVKFAAGGTLFPPLLTPPYRKHTTLYMSRGGEDSEVVPLRKRDRVRRVYLRVKKLFKRLRRGRSGEDVVADQSKDQSSVDQGESEVVQEADQVQWEVEESKRREESAMQLEEDRKRAEEILQRNIEREGREREEEKQQQLKEKLKEEQRELQLQREREERLERLERAEEEKRRSELEAKVESEAAEAEEKKKEQERERAVAEQVKEKVKEKETQEQAEAEERERERVAAEAKVAAEKKVEEEKKAEEERIVANEKAAAEKSAAEKAEQERIAAEKAEQERIAAEKAAAEKAEQERIAAERAAAERAAAERAEQERVAAEKAEQERIAAAEKAEQERIAKLPQKTVDVAIIGGGVSGLTAAKILKKKNPKLQIQVLEKQPTLGGRVNSDVTASGFTLDRGFAVFIDSYPKSKKLLNIPKLKLQPFQPGAFVVTSEGWKDGKALGGDSGSPKISRVADPLRRPMDLFSAVLSPVGTLADKIRVIPLLYHVFKSSVDVIFEEEETSTLIALKERWGFR